jgi:hypothetical protein
MTAFGEGPSRPILAVSGEWGRIPIMEVVMRPPEVFVRSLSHQEAVKLAHVDAS